MTDPIESNPLSEHYWTDVEPLVEQYFEACKREIERAYRLHGEPPESVTGCVNNITEEYLEMVTAINDKKLDLAMVESTHVVATLARFFVRHGGLTGAGIPCFWSTGNRKTS